MNLYYYLYYLIYKFLILNATSETKERVPYVSSYLLLIGVSNYYLFFLLRFNLVPLSSLIFAAIFIVPITLLYFFNESGLIRNKRYKIIESHFDKNNKLKKIHFILLAVLFLLGSIFAMIWAGINYSSTS